MSIGQLGSSGQPFRDFLGGGQRDIGRGLQAVLANYASPNGNFMRLQERAQGNFQLSSSEYQSQFDRDAQNSFAQTWYSEYRAVLMLRAEALKKKLNRAYHQTLENSIYAPMRPNERWAPQANRDHNDIRAESPLAFYSGATVVQPPTEAEEIDTYQYLYPEWFSGSAALSGGETDAYNDIRRYINSLSPLEDLDGDGTAEVDFGAGGNSPYTSSTGAADNMFYDLWNVNGPGPVSVYDLNAPTAWYSQIAENMNVPPTTTTTNFVYNAANPANTYYIEVPSGMSSKTAAVFNLLPQNVRDAADLGVGIYSVAAKASLGIPAAQFVPVDTNSPADPALGFYLDAGTKFYDPQSVSQSLFLPAAPFPYVDGVVGMTLNPHLVAPPGANLDAQEYGSVGLMETYQQGFFDSWREARQLQKREAQVEAAYKAYLDGKTLIETAKGGPVPYAQIMDQVFEAINQVATAKMPAIPPGDLPPGVPGFPAVNFFAGLQPYGTHHQSGGGLKNPTVNPVYAVGSAYSDPIDAMSVYGLIHDRLAIVADPTNMPGASGAPDPLDGVPPPDMIPGMPPSVDGNGNPIPGTGFPPTPITPTTPYTPQPTLGDSHLYSPIPIGAAELNDGQPNTNYTAGTAGLTDTTGLPFTNSLDAISNLFVGRQWDYAPGFVTGAGEGTQAGTQDVAPVRYEAETLSSHYRVVPFMWYDPLVGLGQYAPTPVGTAQIPPIDGFALHTIASTLAFGLGDDAVNTVLGGPFFHVGGGSDSRGIIDLDGTPAGYSMGAPAYSSGVGTGIGGIYWGHTSAVGTLGKVERLMTNSGGITGGVGPALEFMNTSLGILSRVGGAEPDEISYFPNVGIGGFHTDISIPMGPIFIGPAGPFWLNIPGTVYGAASYDILTDYLYEFLNAMKHEVIDSVSAYAYATSGGYAMDSYGMRGEYHFTEKTAWAALEKMPELIGLVDVGSMLNSAMGLIGITAYNMNNYDLRTEGVFGGDKRHSMNAAEARELDTGAFFSTAAFLSQFQLQNLEYSYWTGTHQNEEIANMDTLRILALTGKELMKFLNKAIFTAAGRLNVQGPLYVATIAVMDMMLQSYQEQLNENLMWDLLLRDQNEIGFVTSGKTSNSSLTSEGYDFIEDERKLFEFDYEQNRPGGALGLIGSFIAGGLGSFELPNQVLNGMANTRRFKPYLTGPDGRAGRQGYSNVAAGSGNGYLSGTPTSGPHLAADGSPAHPLARSVEGDVSRWDNNWDIRFGFWEDTGMGDINEVYVRKNVVSYGTAIEDGLQTLIPQVRTEIDRYVGSHNRIVGRGYDGATPLNLESFRTGYFANKYFGTFISATETEVINAGTVVDSTTVRYNLSPGSEVDGRTDIVMRLHGGQKYYDRRNDYYIAFNGADLTAKQALAPVLGGRMKLAEVDQNEPLQALGRSTTGQDNPLTKVLYEHMRVRADGSNAQLVREYRDVFNSGLLDDMFITASANAPTGGGVTSSIRIKFRAGSNVAANAVTLGAYETRRESELSGSLAATQAGGGAMTGTLLTEPGYIGSRDYFKNSSKALAEIYLSSFFAFKRQASVKAQ